MAKYADGTEAKVGDIIRGKPHSSDKEVVGHLISIADDEWPCNCQIVYMLVREISEFEMSSTGQTLLGAIIAVKPGPKWIRATPYSDYADTNVFTKVGYCDLRTWDF